MTADPWPSEEEMCELCGCGHTLGQHEYGAYHAACDVIHYHAEPTTPDECLCNDFHVAGSCRPAPHRPTHCQQGHLMPTAVPHGWIAL